MPVDFGRTADDYATYRAGFPDALFDRLGSFGIGRPGQCTLDLGTGTGSLARQLARRGCQVTGLDRSRELMAAARQLDQAAGVSITYLNAQAEALPLMADSFDLVAAGQCWHWFDARATILQIKHVLKPGGQLLIAHFDWLPLPGNVVEATEKLILHYSPDWRGAGGIGIHTAPVRDISQAGCFTQIETFSFDLPVVYSHEAWRGRIRASAGVGASLPPEQIARFDADHAALLVKDFPADPLAVPHRVFALVAKLA